MDIGDINKEIMCFDVSNTTRKCLSKNNNKLTENKDIINENEGYSNERYSNDRK